MRRAPLVIVTHKEARAFYQGFTIPDEEVLVMTFGEALCSLVRRAFDLVMIDCGFQPHTGLALLQDIKSRFPKVPILFLTDESSEEIAVAAFKQGVRDYFRKPVDLFVLRATIHGLLQAKRQAREERQKTGTPAEPLPEAGALCGVSDLPSAIMRAVCYTESNYRKQISLEDMARQANMSKAHFCRVFKTEVGMSPVRYLKYVRIEQAKKLLQIKRLAISHVASQVGFQDVSNFNKNFRLFAGLSPTDYRRSLSVAI